MTDAAARKTRPGEFHIYKSDSSMIDQTLGPLSGFKFVATVKGSKKEAEAAASKAAGTELCTIRILQDRGVGTLSLKPDLSWG